MNKEEYKIWLKNNVLVRNQKGWRFLFTKGSLLFEFTKELREGSSICERVYFILNDLTIGDVICSECKENVLDYNTTTHQYRKYCSVKCARNSIDVQTKYRNTCLRKYGVDNPRKCTEISERIERTCLERYGCISPLANSRVQEKIKYTVNERYGVDYTFQSEKIKEKRKITFLERYDVDNLAKILKVQEKIASTNLCRYGESSSSKNHQIKDKTKRTCLERYGVEAPLKSLEIKEKSNRTLRKKNYQKLLLELKAKSISLLMSEEQFIELDDGKVRCFCHLCNSNFESDYTHEQRIVCGCLKYVSYKEKEVVDFLRDFNFDIVENSRSIISPYELDIFILDFSLAIEFHGLYWHSELYKDKNYHLHKLQRCQEKNIKLIQIFEHEWIYKQEIVKSIILSKLEIFERRIDALECEVIEIFDDEYRIFCEDNHIQGYIWAKIKLGLFCNNELISIMSFESSQYETEIIRYCTKLNIQMINGFNKLLDYFVNNFEFETLVSYVDLRYFDGEEYLRNGFKIIEITEPNYWYWKNGDMILHNQKHKLKDLLGKFDESLNDMENMKINRWSRIFDAGSLRLKYVR